MTKAELRHQLLQQRKALTPDDVNQRSQLIAGHFFDFLENNDFTQLPSTVHTFLPIQRQNEVDTWLIIRHLWAKHECLKIAVPITSALEHTLTHSLLFPQTKIVENRWGIPEPVGTDLQPQQPTDFDLVLVPLLAFDRQGQRVGYGGGFYDRFLAECRPDCLKVGLSFVESIEQIENTEVTDVPLNACITPEHVYYFK